MNEVNAEDIPESVMELAEDVTAMTNCASCDDSLFDIEHPESGRVWVDEKATIRGDEPTLGATHVGDTGSTPHNLDSDGSDWLCGWCADIDSFEKHGSFLIGVLPRNQSYNKDTGVFVQDTIVDTHYLYRDGEDYQNTPFKQAIEDYALDGGDNDGNLRLGEWFDSEERYYGNNWLETVPIHEHAPRLYDDPSIRAFVTAIKEHEVEFDFPALISGTKLWVPSQHVQDARDAYIAFMEENK